MAHLFIWDKCQGFRLISLNNRLITSLFTSLNFSLVVFYFTSFQFWQKGLCCSYSSVKFCHAEYTSWSYYSINIKAFSRIFFSWFWNSVFVSGFKLSWSANKNKLVNLHTFLHFQPEIENRNACKFSQCGSSFLDIQNLYLVNVFCFFFFFSFF